MSGRGRIAGMAFGLGLSLAAAGFAEAGEKNRILFLIAEGANRHEFNGPFEVGRAAGYEFDLCGPTITNVTSGKDGAPVGRVNILLDDLKDLSPYAGVVIPGGGSPANLAQHPRALEICRKIMDAKLPVLAMCHGPRLLIKAGVMKGRVFTCLPRVADELADEWRSRDCGKFVDRSIVKDGNLLTSPHFMYGDLYNRAMIGLFEKNGGIPVALRPAQVLVATAGASFQPHEKWALTVVPKIAGTRVGLLDSAASLKAAETNDAVLAETVELYVLPGKDVEKTLQDESFVRLMSKLQQKRVSAIGVNAAFEKMKAAGIACVRETVASETYAAYVRLIVKRTQQSGQKTPAADEAAKPATASIRLIEGFDARQYAALRAFLDWSGETAEVTGPQSGWMRGKEGCPVRVDRVSGDGSGAKRVFAVSGEAVKAETPEDKEGAAASAFARGAAGSSDERPFTAAIALREGFDDAAYAALRAALDWAGRKTVIVGPEKGELRGLNGVVAQVAATYEQAPDLAAGAIVVLPGGLYPDKVAQAQQAEQPPWLDEQDKRDAVRLKWVMDAYGRGATLVVFGYDGARVGGLDSCKDLPFAAPGHAGSKFGQKGAKTSSREPAMKTKERLYSAQTDESLGALLRLLETEGLIGRTAKP